MTPIEIISNTDSIRKIFVVALISVVVLVVLGVILNIKK